MAWRLTIVQNRPTQFDMPLYARMHACKEWGLQVIYTDAAVHPAKDLELGHAPIWDHVAPEEDCGIYLDDEERKDVTSLSDRIALHSPNLVVLCGYYPVLHARLVGALKRRNVRIGLRSDNTLPHGNFKGLKGVAKRLLLPNWLARYDCWLPVGSLAQRYLESLSIQQRPVFPFPYVVDVNWFQSKSGEVRQNRAEYRAKLGLSDVDFVVLGIMKWHEREDPITLLRAFTKLLEKKPGARLVLLGDGPLSADVRRYASECGGSVILPGYQPYSKLPAFYGVSDVFVHPSVNEPWGVSIQEAMSCGLPVLVAEGVGARHDLLEHGVSGEVFPNGDFQELARQLCSLADSPTLLARMRSGAGDCARRLQYEKTMANFSAACLEMDAKR